MQNKIAIVLPVRDGGLGRRSRVIRCLKSYYEITDGLSDIHMLHDKDECDIYHPIAEQYPQVINYCIPEGISLMEKINLYVLEIANKYSYIGFIGDDIVFKTNFEKTFIDYLSSVNHGMAFANDLVWNGKLPTHPFMTTKTVIAVGFFGCPAVQHNYFDNYWKTIFEKLGTSKYFDKIIMEHMHAVVNKEDADPINLKIANKMYEDEINYYNYIEKNLENDLKKIGINNETN